MLAEAVPQEVADARSLQAKGMYREAHALRVEAVDRLCIGQQRDIDEIVGNLRRIANTQLAEKLPELDEAVGRVVTAVAGAGDQILKELITEVPSVVEPLSLQVEIRTFIGPKKQLEQLEAIYGDLGKRAAEQLSTIFQQRFKERITPDVSAALGTISVLPPQFRTALDEHLLDAAPADDQDTQATWATVISTLPLKELLSAESARLVDLRQTEQELLIYEFSEDVNWMAGKSAFSSVFAVLLSAVLKLLWTMFRDPLSGISKERRVQVVKRRLVTALQYALNGKDVRSAVGVASRGIETELRRKSELVRHSLEETASTIGSADFAHWFGKHVSTVHQVLDRAAAKLAQIDAGF